ncbi:MAG: 50S ribosomal protein L10 [Deltaproteobacteria bacterium]
MDRTQKQQAVDELHAKMAKAAVGIVTQLNGIDVATVTDLRKQLREAGIDYRVVKNTLAKRAAQGTPIEELSGDFKGPVALAMSYADPVTAAKILTKFVKGLPQERAGWLKIKAGVLSGKRLDSAGVTALSALPGLPELRGKIVGLLAAPASTLARLIATPAGQLARVVDAHAKQTETPKQA